MNAPIFAPGLEPAFPHDDPNGALHHGLSKRELFAAMAMQGLLGGIPGPHLHFKELATESVRHADALLTELAKRVKT